MSVLSDGALKYINAHLGLELLIPEATLRFLNHLNVPADKLVKLTFKVSEVLGILRNQISIVGLVVEGRLAPLFVLLNLLKELRRCLDSEVLAHAELRKVNHWSRVDLVEKSVAVSRGVLEVSLEPLRLDHV